MKLQPTPLFAISQAGQLARQACVALGLLIGLASCGNSGTAETAGSGAPTVLPATTAGSIDSAKAALTTPVPDATSTGTAVPDTATAKPAVAKPLGKPKATLSRPVAQPLAEAAPVVEAAPSPEPAPAAPEPVAATPTTRTQAGRVLDEDGHPLVGATVLLRGSDKGTSTDASGNYSLEVPSGEDTFVIGYGGYTDEVATTHDGQPLNVTLVPNPSAKVRGHKARH